MQDRVSNGSKIDAKPAITRGRLAELIRHFYNLGWMRDFGGGMAVLCDDVIYNSPTAMQKDKLDEADLFVLDANDGQVLQRPDNPASIPSGTFELLFKTKAKCVIHTHSKYANLLTKLIKGDHFTISHQEMIKGIENRETGSRFNNIDHLIVPIIDMQPDVPSLISAILRTLEQFPECSAVLVRAHGVFVFGSNTWQSTKSMLECYEYLFELACELLRYNVPLATEQNHDL